MLFVCVCAVITRCYRDGNFRLVNDTTDYSSTDGSITVTGRIEVCSNSTYKSLCNQYWDPIDAQVFCQDYLRYRGSFYSTISKNITTTEFALMYLNPIYVGGHTTPPSQYGYSRAGVAEYDVSCNGSERSLDRCDLDSFPDSTLLCQDPASSAAGVECVSTGMSKIT